MVNLKNLKNLKQGIKNLTPEQMLDAKISGTIGSIVGFSIAFVALTISLFLSFDWVKFGFVIILFFGTTMNITQLVGLRQQKEQFKSIKQQNEDILKQLEGGL